MTTVITLLGTNGADSRVGVESKRWLTRGRKDGTPQVECKRYEAMQPVTFVREREKLAVVRVRNGAQTDAVNEAMGTEWNTHKREANAPAGVPVPPPCLCQQCLKAAEHLGRSTRA